MARAALIASLWLFTLARVEAQEDAPRARWTPPSCVPAWWDEATLIGALRVELQELGLTVLTESESEDTPDSISIVAVPASCDPEATSVRIEVSVGSYSRAREVDLADVASVGRSRTLALAIASTTLGTMLASSMTTDDSEEASPASEDQPSNAEPEFASSSEMDESSGRDAFDEPASALGAAGEYEHRARGPSLLSVELAADGALLPARSVPLAGLRLSFVLRPFTEIPSLVLLGGVRSLFGSAHDSLGEVRGSYFDGALGAGFEEDLGPIRVGLRGVFTVGAVVGEGLPGREGVIARSEVAPVAAIEVAAPVDIQVIGPFAIFIDVHASLIVLGIDARAGARSALPFRDVIPGLRLGVRLDL